MFNTVLCMWPIVLRGSLIFLSYASQEVRANFLRKPIHVDRVNHYPRTRCSPPPIMTWAVLFLSISLFRAYVLKKTLAVEWSSLGAGEDICQLWQTLHILTAANVSAVSTLVRAFGLSVHWRHLICNTQYCYLWETSWPTFQPEDEHLSRGMGCAIS